MMHSTSLTKTVFWGHWLAPVTPPEHLTGPGPVFYAMFLFQFGASMSVGISPTPPPPEEAPGRETWEDTPGWEGRPDGTNKP